MRGQSLAIIIVILIMALMFLRTGRRAAALLTLPLFSVPLFYLFASYIYPLIRYLGLDRQDVYVAGVIAGGILGAAAYSFLSRRILSKRIEKAYLTFTLIYQAAITIGYAMQVALYI